VRIRIRGTSQSIDNRTVCKALRYFAKTLKMTPALVETLSITVTFGHTRGFKAEVGWKDRAERPKKFDIKIRDSMGLEATLSALAHEFVHVKQFATGQLRDYITDPEFCRWENEAYHVSGEEDETYWFAPWEVEAYGKERGLYKLFLAQ
jgi:hypothetical protein